jgi:hypothetical protein
VIADVRDRVDRRLDDRPHALGASLASGQTPTLASQHHAQTLNLAAVSDHLHLSHDESGQRKRQEDG